MDHQTSLAILETQLKDLKHEIQHGSSSADSSARSHDNLQALQVQVSELENILATLRITNGSLDESDFFYGKETKSVKETRSVNGLTAMYLQKLGIKKLSKYQPPRPESFHVAPIVAAAFVPSTYSPMTKPERLMSTKRHCTGCFLYKLKEECFTAPCGDHYCKPCIIDMFQAATKDESLYPPGCCQKHIPLSSVSSLLDAKLYLEFNMKAIEYRTKDRTYCHKPYCGAFIPPEQPHEKYKSNAVKCTKCDFWTCTKCKHANHYGTCDEAMDAPVVELGKTKGWQRCPSCQAMVELQYGCNHIT